MIEMSVQLLDWKVRLATNLANWLLDIFLSVETTAIAIVSVFGRNLGKSIAGQVKGSVAAVAV